MRAIYKCLVLAAAAGGVRPCGRRGRARRTVLGVREPAAHERSGEGPSIPSQSMPALPVIDAAERRRRIGARHFLATEARSGDPVEVADRLAGIHATDPASVYLGLRARVRELTRDSLARALYDERSLLKFLGMRRTMFATTARISSRSNAVPLTDICCNRSRACRIRSSS